MSSGNLRIIVLLGLLCVYCCSLTTYRDRVLLYTMRQVGETALAEPSDSLLFEGAMSGMIQKMREEAGDVYSEYIPFQQEKAHLEQLDARIEGIGVRLQSLADSGQFKVLFPIPASPAFRAGIKPNDRIIKVNGKEVAHWTLEELSNNIKGPAGTQVVLTVLHPGESEPLDIAIVRSMVQQRTVYGFSLIDPGQFSLTLPNQPDIGYLYISSFNSQTADELKHLLQFFIGDSPNKGRDKKLILDLRGDPGGYLDAAVDVCDFFVNNSGKYKNIVTVRSRAGSVPYPATNDVLYEGTLVVLLDGGSASAAEIVAAALQDFDRALIFGERSYGKGTVQKLFELPFQSGILKLTEASYWRPNGQNINRVRFLPESKTGKRQELSKETDDWGVRPNEGCTVEISKRQRLLTLGLREYRSNVPESELEPLLLDYVHQFVTDPEKVPILTDDDFDEEELPQNLGQEGDESEQPIVNEPGRAESLHEPAKLVEPAESVEPTKPKEQFQPQGTVPYYDPVLEKAITLL